MRILMFHDFADIRGGANQYRIDLTDLLREIGFEVSLFTFNAGEEREDVETFHLTEDGPLTGRIKHHLFHPGLFSAFRKFINTRQPDLVHVQGNCLSPHTVYLACPDSLPLIQTAHDIRLVCPNEKGVRSNGLVCPWSFGAICVKEGCVNRKKIFTQSIARSIIRKTFLRPGRYLITPSRALGENFSHFGLDPVLLPNFVSRGRFDKIPAPGGSRNILFVGSLYPSKGVERLLRAFSGVRAAIEDCGLEIVGEGPEEANLKRLAGQLDIDDSVTFRGRMNRTELDALYARSRVLVLPSVVKENCPLVVLEAMAAGRPVVASRLGGITELVQEGKTGYLVPYGETEEMTRALTRIFESDELTNRMGEKGRERAGTEYTVENHLAGIMDIYERAVGRKATGNPPEEA